MLVLMWLRLYSIWARIKQQGILQFVFMHLRALPGIKGLIDAEMAKVSTKISASIRRDGASLTSIPSHGTPAAAVLHKLKQREAHNIKISPGSSSLSGVVYISDEAHKQLLDDTYSLFSWTNPLHADIFPSIRQMEAEVVAMTASMLGGGPDSNCPSVCGAMTSGGTESILMAIKASRDFMKATKGITQPEMIVGQSAHAAYWKAAEYFNIKLIIVPLGNDYRLNGKAVARRITGNTILVVASAPGFPHGVIDDVRGIAAAASRKGVPCHVDACLGGFLLPFAKRLGYPIHPFDFSVPGVTSMSVDTHKFGMAHKGTSVVLYRSPALRRYQFTRVTDWTGGLYISPSMAGSRSGALIATAWASIVHLGEAGLLDAADKIMAAAQGFQQRLVKEVPEVELVGKPDMSVVAFKARRPKEVNVYVLNDQLTARGWHLNALQFPAALHFCFTAQHYKSVDPLLADIKACIEQMKANPTRGNQEGSAPLYGLAGVSPDRGLVGEFLVAYQDAMLAA
eukprot:jgi/Chrzof1/11096/Cz05g23150.t1